MMKSLIRWGTTLGLVGTTLVGTVLGGNLQALALSEEEILEQLRSVPVFTITDSQGAPLVASSDEQRSVAGAFISQQDALAFIEKLKQENAELGNSVRVLPVSLGEIYKLNNSSESQEDAVNFAYVPVEEQVEQAVTILKGENPEATQFPGVPLFFARGIEQEGYLTIQVGEQQLIPFFFEKEQLEARVGDTPVKIEVVPLEGVIQAFEDSNTEADDAFLKSIILVPSRESLQFLQSLSPNSQGQ